MEFGKVLENGMILRGFDEWGENGVCGCFHEIR